MLGLFLSIRGRIGSGHFIFGGYILILISIALGLFDKLVFGSVLAPFVGTLTFMAGLVVIVAWVSLWVKRIHNSGKSGALVLAFIAGYGAVVLVVTILLILLFTDGTFFDLALRQASGAIDKREYYKALEAMAPKVMLPIIVSRAISSLIVLHVGNMILPNQSDNNTYGPPPH
ncbi:MAG: DUF805 domain-containing protein [Robiginitomaculum sp.]